MFGKRSFSVGIGGGCLAIAPGWRSSLPCSAGVMWTVMVAWFQANDPPVIEFEQAVEGDAVGNEIEE